MDAGLPLRKFKTPVKTRFASKVVLFQKTLEYAATINICYQRQSVALQARVPSGMTWAVARVVTETLKPIVKQCVLNQTRGYWLLSDALFAALTIYMKCRAEVNCRANITLYLGDFDSELEVLYGRMANKATRVLFPFLSFASLFRVDKAHNMLALMLDPRFKGLQCLSELVGKLPAQSLVEEYDNQVLLLLLVKVNQFLNPQIASPSDEAAIAGDYAFDSLFDAPTTTEEAGKGLLISELSLYRKLLVPANAEVAPLAWWKKNGQRFPNVSFLARQILAIPDSQIETKRIFSIAGVLCNLRRCRLGLENLDALVMIQKNWPSDAHDGCTFKGEVVEEYFTDEADLLDVHEMELEDAGCFEEDVE